MDRSRKDNTEEIKAEENFSLIVSHRHPKSGLIIKRDPYKLRTVAAEGGGSMQLWERPAGSGNLFDFRNNPVGRWDATKPEGDRYIKDAEHIVWIAPETEDEKLARSVAEKDVKIQELQKELAAIKAEKEKKSAPQKKDQGA